MAGESYSPNMNLVLPGVGVTAGPVYANDLNQSLNILDQHNHAPGSGVQITPDGLNINSNFTMNNNNIIAIKSLRLQDQVSALSGGSDLGCMYRVADDLYYNDGLGNQIRLTQSGSVAGTSGSIANLVSPASATFVSLSSTIVFQSDVNTAASLDAGSILLRNITASSKALTLSPPAAMASDYSITLPSLPSSQKIMTLDASGNMSAAYVTATSDIAVSSNSIIINTGAVTYDKMSSTANFSSVNIPGGGVINAAINTDYEVTSPGHRPQITTNGRPVLLQFTGGDFSQTHSVSVVPSYSSFTIKIYRNGTLISISSARSGDTGIASGNNPSLFVPAGSFNIVDYPPAGLQEYSVYIRTDYWPSNSNLNWSNIYHLSAIGL